ncbi:MAG: type VI secretion system tip protein VgrG [Planctomycetes bacterium]|nr:type VI secretion system tip protein VgrG [Planctomycetota bacterium]
MSPIRAAKPFRVTTPLASDALMVSRLSTTEQLGRLFEFRLELLSPDEEIDIDKVLGHPMTVSVDLPSGETRYLNGIASKFAQTGRRGGYAVYQATLRPWLWFLTRTADCKIWQEMSIPEIVKDVFREHGFADFEESLSGSYAPLEFCVQYRETAFNFVSRLMEQAGIYYYFRHVDGNHILVLADGYGSHATNPGYEKVPFYPRGEQALRERDHVYDWRLSKQVQPGAYVLKDFDFLKPTSKLLTEAKISRQHGHASHEVFDYPGEYVDAATSYVDARLEELQAQHARFQGAGDVRGFSSGCLFTLRGHPRRDQNQEYLIDSITQEMQNDDFDSGGEVREATFSCSFVAIESRVPFRALRTTPKPSVSGPQTAIVVGKSGDEICTDEHGRVKLQFHWDRYGKLDEKSSCWVRVAQVWAGEAWGAIHIPRVGQEVIVEFLEGDPDRPIVTGRVYNGDNPVPYALPANATQSGLKSRSSKGGGVDNFNEIRMEDKLGEEEMYIHAEKDQNTVVENDQGIQVGNDRNETIDRDRSLSVGRDKRESVAHDKSINVGNNHTEGVAGNMTINVAKNLTEIVAINYSENVGAAMELIVGGALVQSVGVTRSESVGKSKDESVADDMQLDVGKNRSTTIGEDDTLDVGGKQLVTVAKDYALKAKKVLITAEDEIALKTGKAKIVMKKNGDITIEGKKITAKASGDIILKGSKIKEN